MAQKYSVILVGGGTGGHIMPLVAIGEELVKQKISFVYVGERKSREEEIVGELKWPFLTISAGKWRRYWNFVSVGENIADLFRIIKGFFQSVTILQKTSATVVFSKGGHVSLPMIYACRVLGRKLIIHESDAVMGRANQLASKYAVAILTSFHPETYSNYNKRFIQVGIPVRQALRASAHLKSPSKTRPLIMVLGGIQGAMAINNLVGESLEKLLAYADIVHSTGKEEFKKFEELKNKLSNPLAIHYKPYGFIDRELSYYYQLADLIISRSSATTIAEAAIFGKAMYLIPLPNAASDHQNINAQKLAAEKAVVVRSQALLTKEEFTTDILRLLKDKQELAQLGSSLKKYFNEEQSVEKSVEVITSYLPRGKNAKS